MKSLEGSLSTLRRYYSLARSFSLGCCWLPFYRRRLKSIAKGAGSKNIILMDNGFLMPVDAADPVTYGAWFHGVFAPDLEWAIRRYVKPGSIAVDVGANLGIVSVLMADRVGGGGQVFAIEPNPEMRLRIEKIFWLNGLSNYKLFQYGCSDKKQEAYFSIDPKDHSKSGITSNPTGLRVDLLPLDAILEGVDQPVSFLKIDVEGHEPEVLAGAGKTLQRHRPALVFETGTHTDAELTRIEGLLFEASYEVVGILHEWGVESKKLSIDMTPKSHCNVLALPRGK